MRETAAFFAERRDEVSDDPTMPRHVFHPIDVPMFASLPEWVLRLATHPPSARTQDNTRLVARMRDLHTQHDGVLRSPRIWEELRYAGEGCDRHRVAHLMRQFDYIKCRHNPRQRRRLKMQYQGWKLLTHLSMEMGQHPSSTFDTIASVLK